ncbi:MAG: DsbA family protein [Paracoccaceae bacterium]|nr:MAG: DsbA family protein [Paracoccaceae bacterium]
MMRKFGLAALALALVAGAGLWASQQRGATPGQTMLPGLAAEAQTATADLPEVPEMAMGNPDAKVKLVEYASYTCPHCATFHANVLTPLKRDYIDTGKVHFTLREVYFDRYGLWAAMVARCGGADRYFGISDLLFTGQSDWAGSSDPATVVQNLRRIGRKAGMDDATLDACLNDGNMAQAMVAAFETNARADDVQGTPTLIINGQKHSNMSYGELRAIIDAELAK